MPFQEVFVDQTQKTAAVESKEDQTEKTAAVEDQDLPAASGAASPEAAVPAPTASKAPPAMPPNVEEQPGFFASLGEQEKREYMHERNERLKKEIHDQVQARIDKKEADRIAKEQADLTRYLDMSGYLFSTFFLQSLEIKGKMLGILGFCEGTHSRLFPKYSCMSPKKVHSRFTAVHTPRVSTFSVHFFNNEPYTRMSQEVSKWLVSGL